MNKGNIALGFYQEISTAHGVINELKSHRFRSFASIHHKKDGVIEVHRHFPLFSYIIPILALLTVVILMILRQSNVIELSFPLLATSVIALISGAIAYSFWSYSNLIDSKLVSLYKNRVLIDEILVIVQVKQTEVREVLAVLRQVKSGHPVSFLLRSDLVEIEDVDIPTEPMTIEQLSLEATALAASLNHVDKSKNRSPLLLQRLQKTSKQLQFLRHDVAHAEYIEQTIPVSAEWLLDNMYVIEGCIEDVKRNLPKKFYQELPIIISGPLAGLPRIYAIAVEFVKCTAGRLNSDNIKAFLDSYQINSPLTIGELWALPLMIRFRLIEWIQFLAIHIDNRMREGELASFWGNRLLYAARHEQNKLPVFIKDLSNEQTVPSPHFAEELIEHLFDEESVLPLVKKWFEGCFPLPLQEVLHQEQIHETSEQIVFSNSIMSLISLSQLSWPDIFESVSPVDAILKEDPTGIYSCMDFATRNRYRTIIEDLAFKSKISEVTVAMQTLKQACSGINEVDKHIGYYLIDDGRELLEQKLGYFPSFFLQLHRWITKHSAGVYLGGIGFITTVLEIGLILIAFKLNINPSKIALFSTLSILPLSELSIQIMNFIIVLILPTNIRPRMSFEEGIPEEFKTLVVIPMMLHSPKGIEDELHRLEIRYLANIDPSLYFGLFSDYTDAPKQSMENDASLLNLAIEGIKELESKYGLGKFFLFHRQRVWSTCENAWIGKERKRGKLEYLNQFLMGEEIPENIVYAGEIGNLKNIRYVITLDSDTQLPKDQGRALVEVSAHPLNRPILTEDGKNLKRGFTIIQPLVVTDFPHSKASWFCRIFSEPSAIDPYTQAISNIYQDLFGESSYHGKGIYDVKAFHRILTNRFPEEHLLSHDLIEGTYVRVGFASNITLYDKHPEDYLSWSKRQHRWMRGDWQIIDWLLSYVPINKKATEANPLSAINKWKILDNLRRALLPVSLLLLLITSWLISVVPTLGTGLVTFILVIPWISVFLSKFYISFEEIKKTLSEAKIVILRTLIKIALLPFESVQSLDALIRVMYRRAISHRNLLQWTTSESVHTSNNHHKQFLIHLSGVSLLGLIIFAAVSIFNERAELIALPFCFLWIISPLIVYFIDRPISIRPDYKLSDADRQLLRHTARKTWRYFDDFVGPQTHWLPPDNYQAALNIEIAQRTSPTNIGMWLFAIMNAYDFKYITCDDAIEKVLLSIEELKKLERYEGHFLNWYNIQTLNPLFPRYISTVDSGNLLACFWTLKQGLIELGSSPIIPEKAFEGVRDTYEILQETKPAAEIENPQLIFNPSLPNNLPFFIETLRNSLNSLGKLTKVVDVNSEGGYWLKQIEKQLAGWESVTSRYFSWAEVLAALPMEQIIKIDKHAFLWRDELLSLKPSLETLDSKEFLSHFTKILDGSQRSDLPEEIKGWGKQLNEALSKSQWLAGESLGHLNEIIKEIDLISHEMNLKYLYNPDRKLFSIGYNIDDKRLDTSHYDLLASEARIASLVAIAKGDAPVEHWWSLGRFYSTLKGRRILLSWGGTMFEYLMPLIFTKQYSDSLLGEACNTVVACQMQYGKKRGIPWGISESAFSAIDSHKIYQYKSFGIPGIGLKRGLEEDLVVSPYSTALALIVDTKLALKNLRALSQRNPGSLLGTYGYYESIDYSRQSSPEGERGVIVYAFMAHHQGMILSSINNTLNNYILNKRFHDDPRISGVNSLLYERIPTSPPVKISSFKQEHVPTRLKPFSQSPILGVVKTPESLVPKINLLSNANYSLMITNSGGGYSRWKDLDISRWRSDTTRDCWGSYFYIKDIGSNKVWSATSQPTVNSGKEYTVNFKTDKVEFRRKDFNIETLTEIVVSPEDNAEIRLITLINHSNETRTLEITSYIELALAPHLADRAHPCFNKLFIETEALPEHSALLAFRRLRSPEETPLFAGHVVATNHISDDPIQYETDRNLFIGRGKSLKNPTAMESPLSNTAGTVLDPIFSLRKRIDIPSGRRLQISFITAVGDNRESVETLIKKYKDILASQRVLELAWAYAQLEMRHLRIQQEEAQLFQKLAGRLLYPHAQLRSVEERLKSNRLGQPGLWAQGISGDLPIVVVTVGDLYDVDLVKQVLIAHSFWHLRGLKSDLIILNEEITGYLNPLQEQLERLIQAYSQADRIDKPGGIFLRNSEKIPVDELNIILSCARAILVAARGSLRQQLVSPMPRITYPPKLIPNSKVKEEPSKALPFMELPYFNGLGGYTADGHSYVIYLGPNVNTPAPWINVLANPSFGTLVSESGLGCTWYGNSQSNRLTPWSNDPVTNSITDAIYILDEELGTFWTPTPGPIRELDAYRITHSQGYSQFEHNSHGIGQNLLVFVPVNDEGGLPLRIQRLRLTNQTNRRRKLTATAYSEWVLGNDREDMQMHIITEWDSESQGLFASNRYNADYGSYVAFTSSVIPANSFTGDRTEFLGRNKSTSTPEALRRQSLSGHTGAALDPCSALQSSIELEPNGETEIIFIMGYAPDAATARQLILQCRSPQKIDQLFADTKTWWDKTLGTIQVEVPDLATNFLMNRWALYQNLCCRFWGRSGFYQSSGAYGFRDQLQDSMAIVYALPKIAREHIVKTAARQFIEGDVQHWWHPQTGGGVRTRFSDDLLWLPFVTAHYVRVTGDISILEEKIPFLEAPQLTEDQHEIFQIPTISQESESLLEHCRRSLKKGTTKGAHGLPLMGCGDWNDGMNRVGIHGKGESVWLAWFLTHVMNDFADLINYSGGLLESGDGFRVEAKRLAEIIESTAWDGAWYRRAYFDNGDPLGSKESDEATIDSLAQSWSIISGHANSERSATALKSAEQYLVNASKNLVLLLTPPFDKTHNDPGYIKGYPPGVRENGGQYTHGSLWLALAYARSGEGNKAVKLLQMMAPTSHTSNAEANALYKVEPYVVAADIYDLKSQVGRGGWTWYTGSAAWMYRIWLEEILGFKLRGQTLSINCTLPSEWDQFKITYRHQTSVYTITVTNPHHLSRGLPIIKLDGNTLPSQEISLVDDGKEHVVDITLDPYKENL